MTDSTKQKGIVTLYACGGTAGNLLKRLENFCTDKNPAMAQLKMGYIDTSDSNAKGLNLPADQMYLIPGLDGSGQVRKKNIAEIEKHMPAILQKIKPTDFNIFLHSGGGGSGSVAGPVLAGELLSKGQKAVVIMIGDRRTTKHAENTMKTIQTYQVTAEDLEVPVNVTYFENTAATPRGQVDDAVVSLVGALLVFFSRLNAEMDSEDIGNFLNFSKPDVTSFKPRLAQLSLVEANNVPKDLGTVISVATLATRESGTDFPTRCAYQIIGYVPEDADNVMLDNLPIHFMTSTGQFGQVVEEIDALLTEDAQAASSLVESNDVLTSAKPTRGRLVL